MKSKTELKNKYLNPKKKKKRNNKIKEAKSKIIDLQDQDYMNNLEKALEAGTEYLEDEKPVFVETEESRKLSKKEKDEALEKIYGKKIQKSKQRNQSGKWVNIKTSNTDNMEIEEENEEEEKMKEESIEEETSSSEEEGLNIRHDSSDSEIEEDPEEAQLDKEEREKRFKENMNRALGMGKGVEIDTETEESDSDLDSGSSEEKDALAEKLEQLKEKDKIMRELAKEFKNAATIFRDQEGKKMSVEEFEAAKKQKLEKLNQSMVIKN